MHLLQTENVPVPIVSFISYSVAIRLFFTLDGNVSYKVNEDRLIIQFKFHAGKTNYKVRTIRPLTPSVTYNKTFLESNLVRNIGLLATINNAFCFVVVNAAWQRPMVILISSFYGLVN